MKRPVRLVMTYVVMLLAGSIFATGNALGEVYTDRIVAVVNGDVILESDVEKHKQPLIRNLTNLNLGVVPPGKWPTERELLDELIVLKLLEQEAAKKGINPNEESVDASIDMVRKRNNLSEDRFVLFLAANGLNYSDFRNLFRRKIKLEGLIAREVTKKVPFSEEDAQLYFKNHTPAEIKERWKTITAPSSPPPPKFEPDVDTHEDLYLGGRVRLRLISLKIPPGQSRKGIARARNKAKKIYTELMNGADFAALAKRYSEDPLASKGGDLGFMAYKDMRPQWQKMVQRMKKGQVLGPVQGKDAILMFYLDDAKGRKIKKVPIPEKVRQQLIEQQREMYEKRIQARNRQQQGNEDDEASSGPNVEPDTRPSVKGQKKDKPSAILSPDEEKEYRKLRRKVLFMVRQDKIQARMKEWIEELKKNSIIDVKL